MGSVDTPQPTMATMWSIAVRHTHRRRNSNSRIISDSNNKRKGGKEGSRHGRSGRPDVHCAPVLSHRMPPVYVSRGPASTPTAMGPRAYTSAIMSLSPLTLPYCVSWYLRYLVIAEHVPSGEHVRHVFSALHAKSLASYSWHVSSAPTEMPRYTPLHTGTHATDVNCTWDTAVLVNPLVRGP